MDSWYHPLRTRSARVGYGPCLGRSWNLGGMLLAVPWDRFHVLGVPISL